MLQWHRFDRIVQLGDEHGLAVLARRQGPDQAGGQADAHKAGHEDGHQDTHEDGQDASQHVAAATSPASTTPRPA